MDKERVKKLFVLLSLYIAQSIPMSFFSTVVPVIMRQENYSLEMIGLLQLIKLPWIIKFLWAPVVDRTSHSLKDYKKWIFYSELFYALIILSCGFFDLQNDFTIIIAMMVIAFVCSATQDIATDAFAILTLKRKERGTGNSIQSAGTFTGTLLGSGALLIIYYYLGWRYLLFALAGFVVIALIPLYFYRPRKAIKPTVSSDKKISFNDIIYFFKQRGIHGRIVVLVMFYSGIIGILAFLKPYMVDMNFSSKDIGMTVGIFGTGIACLSALGSSWIIKRIRLRRSFFLASGMIILTAVYFFLMTYMPVSTVLIMIGIALLWGTYGIASVVIYTSSMNNVRKGREGTDFTIQIVITHLSSIIMVIGCGKIAGAFSYRTLFLFEIAMGILSLIVLSGFLSIKKRKRMLR